MKIMVDRKQLLTSLRLCKDIIPGKSFTPILTGVKIETSDNAVKLIGTDLDTSIILTIPATIFEEGVVVLPVKELINVLTMSNSNDVELESLQELLTTRIVFISDTIDVNVASFALEEYPIIEESSDNPTFSVPCKVIQDIAKQVTYATTKDMSIFRNVYLKTNSSGLTAVATDIHRIALRTFPLGNLSEIEMLVTASTINLAAQVFKKDDVAITIDTENCKVYFTDGNNTVIGRITTDKYPNVLRITEESNLLFTQDLTFDRNALLSNVKKIITITKEKPPIVHLLFDDDLLTISSSDSTYNYQNTISIYNLMDAPTDLSISVNAKFLKDCLNSYSEDILRLRAKGEFDPILIESNSEHVNVIMPVRMQG